MLVVKTTADARTHVKHKCSHVRQQDIHNTEDKARHMCGPARALAVCLMLSTCIRLTSAATLSLLTNIQLQDGTGTHKTGKLASKQTLTD